MSVDPEQIRPGMDVVDFNGEQVGTVKAVREADFLIDRAFARDVYAPIESVHAIVGETSTEAGHPRVVIGVAASRVGDMGWPTPN